MIKKGLLSSCFYLGKIALVEAAQIVPAQQVRTVGLMDVLNWAAGLLVVLAVFFLCIYVLRKMGGSTLSRNQRLRVLTGLSLGVREKVIVLQVGNKQLVLAVTPGRIETLHVLEGEDCLDDEKKTAATENNGLFAKKLTQVLKGQIHD